VDDIHDKVVDFKIFEVKNSEEFSIVATAISKEKNHQNVEKDDTHTHTDGGSSRWETRLPFCGGSSYPFYASFDVPVARTRTLP
jgi:hypothetical protein